jgi:hypothetical protein
LEISKPTNVVSRLTIGGIVSFLPFSKRSTTSNAYFNPKPGKPHPLHYGNGRLTRLGKIYQEAGA